MTMTKRATTKAKKPIKSMLIFVGMIALITIVTFGALSYFVYSLLMEIDKQSLVLGIMAIIPINVIIFVIWQKFIASVYGREIAGFNNAMNQFVKKIDVNSGLQVSPINPIYQSVQSTQQYSPQNKSTFSIQKQNLDVIEL